MAKDAEMAKDHAMLVSIPAGTEPCNEREACSSPNWPHWREAMQKEFNETHQQVHMGHSRHTHRYQHCREQVDVPAQKGCQWNNHALQSMPGSPGIHADLRIDYDETFAPVAKFASTHVVLALVAIHNWEVHQIDVKNAYLNAELTEKVYMAQPPSFAKAGQEGRVCRLHKALYGQKQGGRCWYLRVCKVFAKFGLYVLPGRPVHVLQRMECTIIIVVIAVDNLTLASNSPSLLLAENWTFSPNSKSPTWGDPLAARVDRLT